MPGKCLFVLYSNLVIAQLNHLGNYAHSGLHEESCVWGEGILHEIYGPWIHRKKGGYSLQSLPNHQ